jgi:nitroimidazol reductase NimA-like FMN-containing flavoprotein (pyridoxamine 5'-phosphate oxidase superfamily)
MTMKPFAPTARSRLKRYPKRGHYDRETVYRVLDAAFLCHVGYAIGGQPFVTPTAYWREGGHVYWHGSSKRPRVCLTVSIVDGLVVARSGFHMSVNYRAAMLFGRPFKVEDPAAKLAKMEAFVERMYPGHWQSLRPVTKQELKAMTVVGMEIEEASAKIRTGPPIDDEEDYALPLWAGVVPVRQVAGAALDDPRLAAGLQRPARLRDFSHLGIG